MDVMVGGTFDPLHDGHKKLLSRSFEIAGPEGSVIIGITTDEFAGHKSHPVRPFETRVREVEAYIRERGFLSRWSIEPLHDRYGSALETDFNALVVSDETFPVAAEINEERQKQGKNRVEIHRIGCVLAEDGRWISSTRIYRGEIDPHGRLVR
jgi:pantetheine-phosphate adenylyltransferase